jgi:hypothetical protein
MLAELLHLDGGGGFGARPFHLPPFDGRGGAAPFVSHEEDALREVERGEGGVDRDGDDGVRPRDVVVLEARALGAEEDGDTASGRDPGLSLAHRLLGRQDGLGKIAVAGSGGQNPGRVGHGLGRGLEEARRVEEAACSARHRDGARVRPAVAGGHDAHAVEPEVPHPPGGRADVLAHLRAHEDEGGLVGHGFSACRVAR